MVDDGLEVDAGDDVEEVVAPQSGPALVENDIFDAVARGEVDVVEIGLRVDTGLKVNAIELQVVPPVPSHLARPDPRRVGNARGLGQQCHQVDVGQVDVGRGHGHYAPRKGSAGRAVGQKVLIFGHLHLQIVVPALDHRARIGRKNAAEPVAARGVEEHSGIVAQVALGDADLGACVDKHGQEGQPERVVLGQREDGVGVLERGAELAFELAACHHFLLHVGIGQPGLGRRRKVELGRLGFDVEVGAGAGHKAIGRSLIVDAELDGIAVCTQRQRIVVGRDACLGVERRGGLRRAAPGADARPAGIAPGLKAVAPLHRRPRRGQHCAPLTTEAVGQAAVGAHGQRQFPVGRQQAVGLGRSRRRERRRSCNQQ